MKFYKSRSALLFSTKNVLTNLVIILGLWGFLNSASYGVAEETESPYVTEELELDAKHPVAKPDQASEKPDNKANQTANQLNYDSIKYNDRYRLVGKITGTYGQDGTPQGVAIIEDTVRKKKYFLRLGHRFPPMPNLQVQEIGDKLIIVGNKRRKFKIGHAAFEGESFGSSGHYASNSFENNESNVGNDDSPRYNPEDDFFYNDEELTDPPAPRTHGNRFSPQRDSIANGLKTREIMQDFKIPKDAPWLNNGGYDEESINADKYKRYMQRPIRNFRNRDGKG